MYLCFIAIFRSVQKDKEKNEERKKKEILATHILLTAGAISFKFGMWGSLPGRHLCSETSSNQIRDHRATKV